MASYKTTVRTDWSQEACFAYFAEFSNVADWDPSINAGRKLSGERDTPGARWEVDVEMAGREVTMPYETIEAVPPRKVVLRSEISALISVDTLTFDPAPGGGTAVTYDAQLTLKGALKLADPLLQLGFKRTGDKARDGLEEKLAEPMPPISTAESKSG